MESRSGSWGSGHSPCKGLTARMCRRFLSRFPSLRSPHLWSAPPPLTPPPPATQCPLTPEALGRVRAAPRGLGQGTLLAHAFLPVEGHAVSGREGQPETREGVTSQDPRPTPPPPAGPSPSAAASLRVPSGQPVTPEPQRLTLTSRRSRRAPRRGGAGSHATCVTCQLPPPEAAPFGLPTRVPESSFRSGPHRHPTPSISVSGILGALGWYFT